MFTVQTVKAQNPVTTLEHNGTTTVYYGQNSLVDAYNASVNGDYLYLSTGYFTAPASIAKGIKIIGAGHFPDSANVVKRTTIMSGLNINAGADSLRMEGLFIDGSILYQSNASINHVKIFRCRALNVNFRSTSQEFSKNNCSVIETVILSDINFSNFGTNFSVIHCFVSTYGINNILGGAVIDGNIFLGNYSGYSFALSNIQSSLIKNNIFVSSNNIFDGQTKGNYFYNNIFTSNISSFGTNSISSNYINISRTDIFTTLVSDSFDYTIDYRLKSPTTYLGTDGTQVGIYGGATPFKEKGLPSNPQILTKTVGSQTDANGNLQINFKVKAQDN